MAMGGIDGINTENPISLALIWNDKPGQYGEPIGYEIFGVECGPVVIPTRRHQWTITIGGYDNEVPAPYRPDTNPIGSDYPIAPDLPIGNEKITGDNDFPPWCSVNNCTKY